MFLDARSLKNKRPFTFALASLKMVTWVGHFRSMQISIRFLDCLFNFLFRWVYENVCFRQY